MKDKYRPIGEVIDGLLKNMGADRLGKERLVFDVWKEALGEPLASNIKPTFVGGGTLVIAVRDSAWMQELQFMKPEIKRKLNGAIGGRVISNIRFKLGSWNEEEEREDEEEKEGPEPDPETVRRAREAAEIIEDPKLREQAVKTLLAAARRTEENDEDDD